MTEYHCTCNYCGHPWTIKISSYISPEKYDLKCILCSDKNVIMKYEDPSKDIFGYNSQKPRKDPYNT